MKKVIVIGAGIAGLSAAIYAQRSGFNVTLCEQHSAPGGMCTMWKRNGYLFEGAIHWMTGSNPKSQLYQLWEETGALDANVKMHVKDPFYAAEHEGQIYYLYRDINKTYEYLCAISPEDKKNLKSFRKAVLAFSNVKMPVYDIKNVAAENPKRMTADILVKMFPALPVLIRLKKTSCIKYARRFKHPGIQKLFLMMPDDYSVISFIATLASLNTGDGGYPEDGSSGVISRMVKTFESLGGRLLLNAKVKKINIENSSVKSVTLENEKIEADAVIVTQETIAAVQQLFDIPLKDKWINDICANTSSAVCTYVGFGIHAEIPYGPKQKMKLKEPVIHAGISIKEMSFYNYSGYKGYAPQGCTVITTQIMGDTYEFWRKAKEDGRYEEEKQRLSDQMKRAICEIFPQAIGKIDIINIATPLTYERYTGAYHGSWMSLSSISGKKKDKLKTYPGFVKSVKGLFFAGHRLMSPGGIPISLFTGRKAVQLLCREFKTVFK